MELRQALWKFIKRLNGDGHTIVLTTHYLEEAEALCSRIAMLQQGAIVANDSVQNLLRRFSHCYVTLKLVPNELPVALQPLWSAGRTPDFVWHCRVMTNSSA